jgi:hypothetical protein
MFKVLVFEDDDSSRKIMSAKNIKNNHIIFHIFFIVKTQNLNIYSLIFIFLNFGF